MERIKNWDSASLPLDLAGSQVDLWRVKLPFSPMEVLRLSDCLPADDRARIQQMADSDKRRQQILSNGLLRLLLGQYLSLAPGALTFETGAHGKPALAASYGSDLQFNRSHSGAWTVYAFARGMPVGIDVEQVRPERPLEAIAKRFFSEVEYAALAALSDARRAETFYRCWTGKEAVAKTLGKTMFYALRDCEIAVDAEGEITVSPPHDAQDAPDSAPTWSYCLCDLDPEHMGFCAVQGSPASWRAWDVLHSQLP
jgi:4'-phosphopantetheinyl transferase